MISAISAGYTFRCNCNMHECQRLGIVVEVTEESIWVDAIQADGQWRRYNYNSGDERFLDPYEWSDELVASYAKARLLNEIC